MYARRGDDVICGITRRKGISDPNASCCSISFFRWHRIVSTVVGTHIEMHISILYP